MPKRSWCTAHKRPQRNTQWCRHLADCAKMGWQHSIAILSTAPQAFEALGTRIEEHVELVQVGPAAYRVHFEGAGHLDLLNDVGAMRRQLEAAEPGAGGSAIPFANALICRHLRSAIQQHM